MPLSTQAPLQERSRSPPIRNDEAKIGRTDGKERRRITQRTLKTRQIVSSCYKLAWSIDNSLPYASVPSCLLHPEELHGPTFHASNSRCYHPNWSTEASKARHPLITRRRHIVCRHLAGSVGHLRRRLLAGMRPSPLQSNGARVSHPHPPDTHMHPSLGIGPALEAARLSVII